jgi:hypothetical protein
MSGKTMTAAVTPSTPAFATIPAVSTTPVTTENITKLMSSSQSVMSEKTPVVTTLPGQSISITEGAPAAPILPGQSTPTESLIPLPPSLPAQVQKPSVAEIQNMDISTLNSFLDPGKTGASFPLVFAAARAAKEKARAQGMPENEVQRLGQVAAVTAKLYGGDTISKNTTSIGRDFNLNIPRMDISGMKNPFQTTYNNSNSTQLQKTQSKSSSLMNTLLGGDSQSSSTTNQYYENYTEALRGTEAKAPQLEATTNKLTIAPSQAPKVTVPEPPPTGPNGGPRVTVIKSGKKGKSPTLSGSGSETPYINPGNGNKSKFNILGIPVPFF